MKGTCLCGSIEFNVNRQELKLYQCHCSLCRKQSGTYSNAATIVPEGDFRFLKGEDNITKWVKDTGFSSFFCRDCGSPVPNPLRDTGYYWIPAGLLEDTGKLEVVSHIYTGSKASWDQPAPNAEDHADFPEGGLQGHIDTLER